jgi:hypothetical protein
MDYCAVPAKSTIETDLSRVPASEEKEPTWFAVLLAMLIVMNALDGLLTIVWVTAAQAVEANPLMAILLDIHPVLFMTFKCALVSLGAIILWRYRGNTFAMVSLAAACAAYLLVLTQHWQIILALTT